MELVTSDHQVNDLRLEGLALNRPLTGPQTVHLDVANACNTRCTTCWHHSPLLHRSRRPTASWLRRTMSLETFCAVLDDVASLGGLEQVIISGMGEPTLNPSLGEMVLHAQGLGAGVTVITNLLRADLPPLLDSPGELNLLVSVCGVTPEVWQAFHAHPRGDGFQRLERQLGLLRERGFAPKHVHVINALNYHQLEPMVEFAAAFPTKRVSFKLASLGHGTETTALTPAQQLELRDRLVPSAQRLAATLGVDTDLSAFSRQIFPGSLRTTPADLACYMGLLYCRITVQAEVLFCCNTEVSVGCWDGETSFGELWNGVRYQKLRQQIRARRFFRGCQQCGKLKQNLKWAERLRAARRQAAAK